MKCKGLSEEIIKPPATSDYCLTPKLSYFCTKARVEFNGSCSKEDRVTYNHGKIVNIYIVYYINGNYNISRYPALENLLFDAVSFIKNNDSDNYGYSE